MFSRIKEARQIFTTLRARNTVDPEVKEVDPEVETVDPEEGFDPHFLFGAPDGWGINVETWLACEREAKERRLERIPVVATRQSLPGLPPREYKFDEPEGHKPLPPRSALYRPPSLTMDEAKAVEIYKIAKEYLDGVTVTLKPKLAKKHREVTKGERRVIFDDKGKMKEVKGAA